MRSLKSLSDKELTGRLRQLVREEQNLTLLILPHLAEVERRGLYCEMAYGSLFEYCKQEFGYSDASAWRRAGAAIAIVKCPEAWELLKQKRVTMTTLSQVSSIITPKLLGEIADKTKSEVDLIIAAYSPRQAHPDKSRPVLVPKKIDSLVAPAGPSPSLRSEVNLTNIKLSFEQKWKVEGVVSEHVNEKLQRCKKLLSRKYPKGVDYDTLFDELTELFLDKKDPERSIKKQHTPVTRSKLKAGQTRHVPAEVRIKVWKRDGGKCAFVGSNGKRCNSDYSLQFDHYPIPYARGGPSTANNLRLLCAKHNNYTAAQVYGAQHMIKYRRRE